MAFKKQDKLVGFLLLMIGLISLLVLFRYDCVIDSGVNIVTKYGLAICLFNIGLCFIIAGLLLISERIHVHDTISKYEKAKINLFFIIFLSPFFLTIISNVILIKNIIVRVFLGGILIGIYIWSFYNSINALILNLNHKEE